MVGHLDRDELLSVAEALAAGYRTAEPFPHAVIDGLIPGDLIDPVIDTFPGTDGQWRRWDAVGREVKLDQSTESLLPEAARHLLREFNSAVFVEFLERLTGIDGLIPDPHLYGGGLHQIERGGELKIHADFNKHPRLRLDRRLNVLLYLNREWHDEWNGHLELWDEGMTQAVRKVAPVANRMVVFSTTSTSYHGHPEPLACPGPVTRKSMALYYYSNGRPEHELRDVHSTLYQPRPGEVIPQSRTPLRARDFVPPVLARLIRRFR